MNTLLMRKSSTILTIIIALTLLLASTPAKPTQAAAVMDGINMGLNVAMQTTDATNTLDAGWVYTASASYTLGRIEAKFAGTNGVPITIEFYSGPPSLGGVLLASGTFTPTAPAPAGTVWEGVNLGNTVNVVSGNTYFVGFKNFYSSPTTNSGLGTASQIYFSVTPSNYAGAATPVQNDASKLIVRFLSADPPVITSPVPPNGTDGTLYSHNYSATGSATITYSVTAGALPPGLTLSTAGVLSGTPTTPGLYTGTVTATNGAAPDATQGFSIIIAGIPPTITSPVPPNGTDGVAYTHNYSATGSATIKYSVTAGALPPGLTLTTAGLLSGTPTTPGLYTGTVTATNGAVPDATQDFSITIAGVPPTITSPVPPNGTDGVAYTHNYSATGSATITYSVIAGGLPPGLTLTTAGLLSGTPTTPGLYTGTVTATNGAVPDATQDFSITIAGIPPTITSPVPPNGTDGVAYTHNYSATGSATITYSLTAGALPPGLTLSTAGLLSGTPTTPGLYTGTVTATNGFAPDDTQNFSITIAGVPPTINSPVPPDGVQSALYSHNYGATGSATITYSLTAGALPPGLTLSTAGLLSGTPTIPGLYTGTVTATNGFAPDDTQNFSITITSAGTPPTINSPVPPNGTDGVAYSHTYTATGSATITYSLTAGGLPPGLTLSTAGLLSGTPTTPGLYTGTVTATNGFAPDDTQNFSITIAGVPPTINSPVPPNGTQGSLYTHTYTATGSATITYSVTAGGLPPGLTLSTAGLLSGTPTTPGLYTGTVTATNGFAPDDTQNFSITINPVGTITVSPATLPNGTVGTAYSQNITATGGTGPYTFAVTVGTLPTGLTLSTAGLLSGTPTAAGTFNFTITATDSASATGTQAYTVIISSGTTPTPPRPAPIQLPEPPPAPLCTDTNFEDPGLIRSHFTNDADRMGLNCRLIAVNGSYLTWLGGPLTDSAMIGNQNVLDLGIVASVDVFSGIGVTGFAGDVDICLKGSGYIIYLNANGSPRIPQLWSAWTTDAFPGYTCTTLYAPGTVVLVTNKP